jgi:hypothetical protein
MKCHQYKVSITLTVPFFPTSKEDVAFITHSELELGEIGRTLTSIPKPGFGTFEKSYDVVEVEG